MASKMGNGASRLLEDDQEFCRIMRSVVGNSLVDIERCYILYQLAKRCDRIWEGSDISFVEVGVYRGGTARLLAEAIKSDRTLHLYDTFEGMPTVSVEDSFHKTGDFADTSIEAVAKLVAGFKIEFHKGRFPDTAGDLGNLCMVHVDVDIYESVRDCIGYLWPKIIPGGVMIFDDYGFYTCDGAKKAVDRSGIPVIYLPTGQAMFIK